MAKYKYVNTQTGATFETDVVCSGGPWKQIDGAAKEQEKEPEKEPEETPKKSTKASK